MNCLGCVFGLILVSFFWVGGVNYCIGTVFLFNHLRNIVILFTSPRNTVFLFNSSWNTCVFCQKKIERLGENDSFQLKYHVCVRKDGKTWDQNVFSFELGH